MNLETILQISVVGFLASYFHLVVGLWVPRIGLPRLNLSMAMSHLSFGPEHQEKPPYLLGMAIVQMNGILFALLYAAVIGPYLPGIPLVKGLIWGGMLLLVSQLFFVPVFLREGVFLTKLHPKAWMTAIILHSIYGAILGWLCPIID